MSIEEQDDSVPSLLENMVLVVRNLVERVERLEKQRDITLETFANLLATTKNIEASRASNFAQISEILKRFSERIDYLEEAHF